MWKEEERKKEMSKYKQDFRKLSPHKIGISLLVSLPVGTGALRH